MKKSILYLLMVAAALTSCGSSSDSYPSWSGLPDHLTGGIAVYGDSRSGHDDHRRIVAGIEHIAPLAILHSGDLVNNGTLQSDWDIFNDIAGSLLSSTEFYPAVGNHDEPDDPGTLYFDQFELPGNERWYSVSVDGIRFIILDTVAMSDFADTGSAQFQWLEGELQAAGAASTVAAVFHYPPYSTGSHGSYTELHTNLVPLFETWDVDLVLNGHDHNYERSLLSGIHYVVTGGGGAPLRGQSGSSPDSVLFASEHHFCVIYRDAGKLMVDAWSDQVELIDRFEVDVP
jgi:3',5'-cyclic AMP phosphodiesterase CpdA